MVRRYEIPVYAGREPGNRYRVALACLYSVANPSRMVLSLKGLVEPFSISMMPWTRWDLHFVMIKRCVLATDLGVVTPQVEAAMHNAQVLI